MVKVVAVRDDSSKIFSLFLWTLKAFRRPYLWARKKWPDWFEGRLDPGRNLDTSRMLARFNAFHRLFFSRGFDKIRFDEADLQNLTQAGQKGPLVFLMRNWGQVEYNFFNHLFLSHERPLVAHNNVIKMGHWMPRGEIGPILFQKIDTFFRTGAWPYNHNLFHLENTLQEKRPLLYCLNLPKGIRWIEADHEAQRKIFQELLAAQAKFAQPLQLIPLHFIYDKHPGKAQKSLTDILLGARENPGYLRKMILFLRSYKQRAVAKISEPFDLQKLAARYGGANNEAVAERISIDIQRAFEVESRQVTGPKLQNRRQFLGRIVGDPHFRDRLEHFAAQDGISFEKAEKKALAYLREIASDIHFTVIELWDFFLTWLFNSLYDGIEVDAAGLAVVKKLAKDSPLVLVPCHKSHVDYLLLSYIFYQNDLSLPHVCAGINLNFWPLGPIFRKSGGYFIRRSLPGDALYPLALKSYIKELMREGYFQEFFIEGTRSRSGKLFPPKTGLLQMMVESFLEGGGGDLYFVPVALGYERVLEEVSYLKENKGAKKRSEKFTDLFRLPKFLKRRYGRVYLQFAEPISLKQAWQTEGEAVEQDPGRLKSFVAKFADRICVAINDVGTLMPSALVATALLAHRGKSMTPQEALDKANDLLTLARQRGARLSDSLRDQPQKSMEEVLQTFVAEGLVREHQDTVGRFFTIREETRSHLDFFKNQGMHVFAEPALEQLCENRAPGRRAEVRLLLSKEFILHATTVGAQHVEPLQKSSLQKSSLQESSPQKSSPQNSPLWLSDILLPLLESYWIALDVIEQVPFAKWDERRLSQQILELGETLKMRGTVEFSESLSRFSTQNAIAKFTELGVLTNHQAELGPSGKKLFSPGPNLEARRAALELLETLLGKSASLGPVQNPPAYSNVYPLISQSGSERREDGGTGKG